MSEDIRLKRPRGAITTAIIDYEKTEGEDRHVCGYDFRGHLWLKGGYCERFYANFESSTILSQNVYDIRGIESAGEEVEYYHRLPIMGLTDFALFLEEYARDLDPRDAYREYRSGT